MNWYIACTLSNRERQARDLLESLGVECFLPVRTELHTWSDRKKWVEVRLIPGCLFVRTTEEQRLQLLQQHLPIRRFMADRLTHRVAIVPDAEMELFRSYLMQDAYPLEFRPSEWHMGDPVMVKSGPLKGYEGELVTVDGNSRFSVRFPALGTLLVTIPASCLQNLSS